MSDAPMAPPAGRLADTPGGRIAQVLALTRIPVRDDEGNVIGYESLITPEQARKLLDWPDGAA